VVLHFKEDLVLRNILILNTRWATEAVYQILFDNEIIENGGEFDTDDLGRVWNQDYYSDKHGELLQLMLNFELCYEIGKTQKYIIPDLLPEKAPTDKDVEKNFKEREVLHFEYRYDFMPKGIISRLIVRMNKYIYNKQQWKNGVVVQNKNTFAEIVENFDKRVLNIRIAGIDRLEMLANIREKIDNFNDSFENLIVHEMVPCNCPECQKSEVPHFFDYEELKQYKREGILQINCRVGKIKPVDVLTLISDVFLKEQDKMKGKRSKEIYIDFKPTLVAEGGKAGAQAEASAHADVDVSIDIDVKVDLPAIQDDFAGLKAKLVDANPKLKEELNRIEDSLDEVSAEDEKKELKKPMNKMRRFLENLTDENSDFYKAIEGTKKGIELAQKVGKTYNKFAQWLALPQVPDLFLGK
jgi:predicted  nucleic acid-binding Zn-ribbon protein